MRNLSSPAHGFPRLFLGLSFGILTLSSCVPTEEWDAEFPPPLRQERSAVQVIPAIPGAGSTASVAVAPTQQPPQAESNALDRRDQALSLGSLHPAEMPLSPPLSAENKVSLPAPYPTPLMEGTSGEGYHSLPEQGFQLAANSPLSTFAIDVDTASYSNVRRFLLDGQIPPAEAVRIEEMINYFDYDYPDPEGDPFALVTEISQTPWNPQHHLVHIGLQGKRLNLQEIPANNLVFLVDVSGSMADPLKLPLLKSAFQSLVEQLRPQDHVSIVVYAGAAGVVLDPTSGNQKSAILAALNRLEAGGSTAGGAGIQLAYDLARQHFIKGGNNRVILATDGDFNVGLSSDSELITLIEKERKDNIFLTVLGFGTGNLQDGKMEQLANHGNGNYAYIDSLQEAKKVVVSELGANLVTLAKDVKLQIEFNPAHVKAYRLIGYENRLLANEDFHDDQKDAGELGAGHSVTALYEIVPVGSESDALLPSVDSLRYQQPVPSAKVRQEELLWLKLRYQQPTATQSQLLTVALPNQVAPLTQTSDNFRFSAAVAAFAMILRGSPYIEDTSLSMVEAWASDSLGSDTAGYRREFLQLLDRYAELRMVQDRSRSRFQG
ncbi:MAG: VWA domain-containing protein [Cyanobacteriota bacterium]|nr:VWA domain-containing protein [Cyanobacteriota bacterium]